MKTEQLTLEYLERMTDPTKFKPFKVKLKEGALPKIKLRRSATYTVQSIQKPSKVFKMFQLHIGRNWYNADMFRLVTEQDHSVTDETQSIRARHFVKDDPYAVSLIKKGDWIKCNHRFGKGFTVGQIESFVGFNPVVYGKEYELDLCEAYNQDSSEVSNIIQYVSEHRDSMSKDSILHFANLIGLIKLGAL